MECFCPPSNPCVKTLRPQRDGTRRPVSGKYLGLDEIMRVEALISALYGSEIVQLSVPHRVRSAGGSRVSAERDPTGALIWGLQPPEWWETTCPWLISHSVDATLLWKPKLRHERKLEFWKRMRLAASQCLQKQLMTPFMLLMHVISWYHKKMCQLLQTCITQRTSLFWNPASLCDKIMHEQRNHPKYKKKKRKPVNVNVINKIFIHTDLDSTH